MSFIENIALGFQVAFTTQALLFCFIGVFIGTFIGVLPGLGSVAGLSMLLPLTYHLPPSAAIIMLAGIYYGAQYGGSIASILLNLPGSPSSAVACLDGHPMSQQGRAGVALLMTTVASFIGATIGIFLVAVFGPALATVGLAFGAAEYSMLLLTALFAAGAIAQGSVLRGLAMVALGVLLGAVGTDITTGIRRYTLEIPELADGIPLVVLALGMFGLAEVIGRLTDKDAQTSKHARVSLRSMIPTREDVGRSVRPIARGAGVGSFFGTLPGTGVTLSAFMAYAIEKRVSSTPERFGKGAIEGITAPEAANNSAAQTAFIPTLTLGVPGDASMALLLGALMIHGIPPGPQFVGQHPDLFWGLIISFWIGNVLLAILNVPLIGMWVQLLRIPYHYLFPAILVFVCIGIYSVSNSSFDVTIVAVFGLIGYVMRLLRFEVAPLLIGFILGPMVEENLRRALTISRGDPMIFIDSPLSAAFVALFVIILLWTLRGTWRKPRPQQNQTIE